MEYYHLMFSIHVVFYIVFVIIISGMTSVIEKGMLYGALSWEFYQKLIHMRIACCSGSLDENRVHMMQV